MGAELTVDDNNEDGLSSSLNIEMLKEFFLYAQHDDCTEVLLESEYKLLNLITSKEVVLEFGTEIFFNADKSFAVLL